MGDFNLFDDWADKNKICMPRLQQEKIWLMPWIDDFLQVAETNGNIEEFIREKNNKLYASYAKDNITPLEEEKLSLEDKAAKIKDVYSKTSDFNKQLDEFAHDVETVVSKYPEDRRKYIRSLLMDYSRTGQFVQQNSFSDFPLKQLKQPPEGFFNKIKSGKKIKDANKYLDDFLGKYEKINLKAKLDDLLGAEGIDKSFLKLKFEAIAGLDAEGMKLYTEDMKEYSGIVQQNLLDINKKIEANTKNVENRKAYFENSELRKDEDEVIRGVTQEIRDGIKNPKQYKVSDWVEGLESMTDDEMVMFNIASPGNSERAKKGIECILKHNGLSAGEKTNQWLIRQELCANSDQGCYEIFSPIMTVKDAKEIMPKLIDDLETAHLSKGLVIPARPKELFKDVVKEPCSQDAIDKGLKNLVQAGKIREALTNPNLIITKEME